MHAPRPRARAAGAASHLRRCGRAVPMSASCACSRGGIHSACRERGGKSEQLRLIEGGGCVGCSDAPGTPVYGTWEDIARLPPLPDPELCEMRSEACCGNTLVIFLICLFVLPMHGASAIMPRPWAFSTSVWMAAIYLEAIVAIVCLFGLMWGDPGVIKRTPETCFPQPDMVVERLRNGQNLEALGNVAEDGRTFCIRCLVWRPDDKETHHCSTCQRCVTDFDHHCGVFGRCIAGEGFRGNMGYFKLLILMGVLGCGTCVTFMLTQVTPAVSPRHSYSYHPGGGYSQRQG